MDVLKNNKELIIKDKAMKTKIFQYLFACLVAVLLYLHHSIVAMTTMSATCS